MPDTVRETFDHLRLTLRTEIPRQLAQPEGGHYVVALLVAIGSEALSRLQGLREERVFVDMTTKHELTAGMASDVYRALRHGIAHTYDTRFIKTGHLKVELIVSWGLKKHLSVRRDPPGLFLNVRAMWEDLSEVIAALETSLQRGGKLPAAWVKGSIQPGDSRAAGAWRQWITTHEAGE
jgi:hypothetical protein